MRTIHCCQHLAFLLAALEEDQIEDFVSSCTPAQAKLIRYQCNGNHPYSNVNEFAVFFSVALGGYGTIY
jgi:hypothetical protein